MRKISKGNIPGYPNYFITKSGILYTNWPRYKGNRYVEVGWHKLSNKRIKNNGYVIATLRNKEGKRHFGIHQLVAIAWIPNPKNLPCVGHKDNVRTHNHYKNLYWCTYKENSQQMVRDGRHCVPKLKVTTHTLFNIYHDLDNGYRPCDICSKYGLTQQQVYKYKTNRNRYEESFKRRR